MCKEIEVLWLQINLPYIKSILLGCCYRPPSSNRNYLDDMGKNLDKVCELNMEVVFMGDMNTDWLSHKCPLKHQLTTVADACCLKQMVTQPTRLNINSRGNNTSSCIDHIFLNESDFYSKAFSVPVGCSDHNVVAIARKSKVPKAKPRVVCKRSYRVFSQEAFLKDVNNICWSTIYDEKEPDKALAVILEKFEPVMDKHAPVRKLTAKTHRAPWVDKELKDHMALRDKAKEREQKVVI